MRLARAENVSVYAEGQPEVVRVETIRCFGEPTVVAIGPVVMNEQGRTQPVGFSISGEDRLIEAQRARLERDLARLRRQEAGLVGKAENAEFLAKAPEQVRRQVAERLEAARERIEALTAQLEELGRSLSS